MKVPLVRGRDDERGRDGRSKPTAYFLVGAQGAGKSTWAAAHAARLCAAVLASDDIRNELESLGVDASHENDRVFATLEARLDVLLAQGRDVLVDATHARRAWREKELRVVRAHGAKTVALWFELPLSLCLHRNASKPGSERWGERVVDPEFVREVHLGLEPPAPDEFDEIRVIGSREPPRRARWTCLDVSELRSEQELLHHGAVVELECRAAMGIAGGCGA